MPRKLGARIMRKRPRQAQLFMDSFVGLMQQMGAARTRNKWGWRLMTDLGWLQLALSGATADGIVFTVFLQFEEPSRALHVTGGHVNGKWNFHDSISSKAKGAIDRLILNLGNLTILPLPTLRQRIAARREMHMLSIHRICGEFLPYPQRTPANRDVRAKLAAFIRIRRNGGYYDNTTMGQLQQLCTDIVKISTGGPGHAQV